jgi:hypothetical protein
MSSPWGSEAKPGGPEWFTFEAIDIANALPPFAGYVVATVIGLPTTQQNTHDFCRLPPPTEFPTALDVANSPSPFDSILTGTWTRFGNLVRAKKWEELCQWKAPPVHVNEVDPPDGYTMYYQDVVVTFTDVLHEKYVIWVGDPLPAGADYVAFRATASSGTLNIVNGWLTSPPMVLGEDGYASSSTHFIVSDLDSRSNPLRTWRTTAVVGNPLHPDALVYPSLISTGNFPGAQSITFDLAVHFPADVPYSAPPSLHAEPGMPVADGPCAGATLADLCNSLSNLHDKVDVLLRNTNPPPILQPDTPIDPEPVDPGTPDPTKPIPLKPVLKPALAVGALVNVTVIPDYASRYGTSPPFFPNIGHVSLHTENGPLASQLLKHNPMVIMPLPMFVTGIQLDLEVGVSATVTWLYPPKDLPPAA